MPVARTFFATVGLAAAVGVLLTAQAYAQDVGSETASPSPPAASPSQPAAASPSQPAADAPESIEEVVVRGRRMSEIEFDLPDYVRDFVLQVSAPPPGQGYARWHRRVCVGVSNLEESAAQYIVDRISRLALDIGLEPGEPGCRPDVFIVFTADAKSTAALMVENQPRVFQPTFGSLDTDLGAAALQTFASSDRAIRWWHVSMPVDARTGMPAIETQSEVPVVNVAGPSRLHSGIRDDLHHAIIIVDSTKLNGTTWQQLGDYLAVVSLAQVDPKADPAPFDSILNLFNNPAAYSGLTDWDRSYVQALYAIDQERIPQLQMNQLVTRMVKHERNSAE
jgi:hypothetical protein